MKDIVRILQDIAAAKELEYHYGKKAALNLLDGSLDSSKIYMLHEFTNRRSEYNSSGTAIVAANYEGKFFLVKHSDFDQQYFQERGNESTSKYTVNIEPLLTLFSQIGNQLACDGLTINQWDNIDITDALDANMDGILCSYKIRVENTYVAPEGEEPGGGTGGVPVITNNPHPNYATAGDYFELQITATGAESYGGFNLPEGFTINEATGLITGTLPDSTGVSMFSVTASNVNGMASKLIWVTRLPYDLTILTAPYDLYPIGYNPPQMGISFYLHYRLRYYAPKYERLEIFIDGELYRTFVDNMPYSLNDGEGEGGDLMQRPYPPFVPNTPYAVKMRVRDYAGNYSDFSEEIIITIPQP